MHFVHPELRPFAEQLMTLVASMPELSSETLASTREGMSNWAPQPLATPAWSKRIVSGTAGNAPVTVYVINSTPGSSRPAILHIHGGGFITGSAADMLSDLQLLALDLDCTIVTVDYRLAPEVNYLGSTSDTYAALAWLYNTASSLGVDNTRIALLGESAGGGHAALLALMARDIGEIPLVAQILIYPMLDDRTGTVLTPPSPIGTIAWDGARNRFGWRCFLGQDPATEQVPAQAVPARATDLSGLPPTFIGVGSIDLFVNEDIAYAQRLINAGVPTQLEVVPGAFHGFDIVAPATKVSEDFTARKTAALRRAFA